MRRRSASRTGGSSLPVLLALMVMFMAALAVPSHATIDNDAIATATYNSSTITSNTASASVPVAPLPQGSLTVVKTATVNDGGDGTDDPGDTISYTFTVTNSSNVSLTNVTLNDPLVILSTPILTDNAPNGNSSDSLLSAPWDLLGPGDALTYTAIYVLTPVDLSAGQVVNTATANATTVPGSPVTASDTETTYLNVVSSLSLDKTAVLNDGGDGIANAGDTIAYSFLVTNTGTVDQTNVSVSDPLLNMASLPGRTEAFTMMAAAATGADPVMTASTAPFDPVKAFEGTVHMFAPVATEKIARLWPGRIPPQLAVALNIERKLLILSGSPGLPKAGDRIGIYFDLVNTGEGPLTNITVEQVGAEAFGNALEILPPNTKDSASIIFTRLLTEADIASGVIAEPAVVRAYARDRAQTFAVLDDLPLAAISGMEELATATILPASVPSLAPGASTTFTATLVLTQADIDAGVVNNTAEASSTDPFNNTITAQDSVSVPLPAVPGISIIKVGTVVPGIDGIANENDTITYTFSIRNSGNVTLSNITVSDPVVTVSGGPLASLAPNIVDNATFTATYAIQQADIDAGFFDNQATATGNLPPGLLGPDGEPTTSDVSDDDSETEDDVTRVDLLPAPAIALIKQLDTTTYPNAIEDVNNNGMADLNDIVHYSFQVQNTGNVTLNAVNIVDRNPAIVVTPAPPTALTLAPAQIDTTSFTAQYVLTQADVDAGVFNNTADVFGTAPDNTIVTDESDPGVFTQNAPTPLIIPAQPGIALLKSVASIDDVNGSTVTDTGDVITYAFTVINTGNVTLTNVSVSDPDASVSGSPIATLLPGTFDSVTITATLTVDAGHMLAGRVTNQATATADTPNSGSISDLSDTSEPDENDPTVTPTVVQPAISVIKQVTGISNTNGNGAVDAGDTIQYAFQVQNSGNVPLTNVVIADPLPGIVVSGGPIPLMDAGDTDTTTFTASYVLTPADIAAGQVVNQATASGTAPDTTVVTDLSDETSYADDDATVTYIANLPSIALVKTMTTITDNGTLGLVDAGDVINYAFSVHNTGNVALTNISIADPDATVSGGTLASLGISAVNNTTFTAQHVITQADIQAGGVSNQATVTASSPTGPVSDVSDESSVTGNDVTFTSLTQLPGIAVIKGVMSITDMNDNALVDSGDLVNYGFAIYNTGNVTLTNVVLTDDNATVSGGTLASLAPGAVDSTTFTAVHEITPADQDAEQVVNQAQVLADSVGGAVSDLSDPTDLSSDSDTITRVSPPTPAFTKSIAKSEIMRGEKVEYTITATSLRVGPYDIADIMPPGFDYVEGSATVDGAAATPIQAGNVLTFAGLMPDPLTDRIIIKLWLRASATTGTGSFINRAQLLDAGGAVLATAQVPVQIKEEHIFDCGEIIGRVFDDLNANGYADEGEPGLPGVRVVTVKGLLVTTDKKGRFHVACADIPNSAIGSNFLMKLDARTLPAGYQLTTENPRDVRLTRGKVTKLNFGAAKNRDIELELKRDAFTAGAELRKQWLPEMERLVSLLDQGRGSLSIVYRCAVYDPVVVARLETVKALVETRWRDLGHEADLKISTRVECGK
jgi:uncharacterized repeat protein (TIGR01451 family)